MSRYCGLVVWYNPDNEVFKNVYSYIENIEKLYIVDNSNESNDQVLENFPFKSKCEYISLGRNTGLAFALNVGCKKAILEGFDYILTMDQDSAFECGAIDLLKANLLEQYAIVCPNVLSMYWDSRENCEKIAYQRWEKGKKQELNWAMTSGSLMSLKAYSETEGFDEGMFIAHLDIDMGIKFHNNNKKILMVGDAIIKQHFGNSEPRKILWKTVHPSFATPVRTYYLFRNQLYLEKKYGKEIKKYIGVSLWKFIVKISLFEDKKIEKYRMMIRAYADATAGKMGVYKEE